jgi:hypothetical protein
VGKEGKGARLTPVFEKYPWRVSRTERGSYCIEHYCDCEEWSPIAESEIKKEEVHYHNIPEKVPREIIEVYKLMEMKK